MLPWLGDQKTSYWSRLGRLVPPGAGKSWIGGFIFFSQLWEKSFLGKVICFNVILWCSHDFMWYSYGSWSHHLVALPCGHRPKPSCLRHPGGDSPNGNLFFCGRWSQTTQNLGHPIFRPSHIAHFRLGAQKRWRGDSMARNDPIFHFHLALPEPSS